MSSAVSPVRGSGVTGTPGPYLTKLVGGAGWTASVGGCWTASAGGGKAASVGGGKTVSLAGGKAASVGAGMVASVCGCDPGGGGLAGGIRRWVAGSGSEKTQVVSLGPESLGTGPSGPDERSPMRPAFRPRIRVTLVRHALGQEDTPGNSILKWRERPNFPGRPGWLRESRPAG